jgi:A/G-specific adenine glycosylase
VDVNVLDKFMDLDHAYSHFKITLHAFWCRILPDSPPPTPARSQEIRWVRVPELIRYPFPKANKVLTEKLLKIEEAG